MARLPTYDPGKFLPTTAAKRFWELLKRLATAKEQGKYSTERTFIGIEICELAPALLRYQELDDPAMELLLTSAEVGITKGQVETLQEEVSRLKIRNQILTDHLTPKQNASVQAELNSRRSPVV